jgi:uncharacterized protein (TIGR02453 family)
MSPTQVRAKRHFSPALFRFLKELRDHNDRDWFAENKARYVQDVQEPALEFVADFAPALESLSPHLVADPRPVGGSVFRIHRDTRFSKDKSPYKTHTGIQFRHEAAKDAHAPGFYLHLEPGRAFAIAGVWHPDGASLAKIRGTIAAEPDAWRKAVSGPFAGTFELEGESLKRVPAGFDADHPLVEDLKRKDFVALSRLTERDVTRAGFADELAGRWRLTSPFMSFLCRALGLPY